MEKEQEKPSIKKESAPVEAAPEVVERADVHVESSPIRCPYCHDSIGIEDTEWVACEACLARAHTACWGELRECAACGHGKAMPRHLRWAKIAGAIGASFSFTRAATHLWPESNPPLYTFILCVLLFIGFTSTIVLVGQWLQTRGLTRRRKPKR